MIQYRHTLPQLGNGLFVTDGGLETTLIYHHGIQLRDFAAFELLRDAAGISTLRAYYHTYARLAASLDALNRKSIRVLGEVRQAFATRGAQIVVSGNVGPRGDGYTADRRMSAAHARDYHSAQIASFADTAADMVAAFTLNYADEA